MLEKNNVYNYDVLDFLDKVDDNSIDLILVDPPYNMNKAKWDTFKNQKDFLNFTYKWLEKSIPKLKKSGSYYVFNNPYNSAFILQMMEELGLYYKNWIVWHKKDGMSASKKRFNNNQETILFFTKHNSNYIFNYDDIRIPYDSEVRMKHASKKGILKNGKRWFPNINGKLCTDVWNFTSERHKNKVNGRVLKMEHITPKPQDLIERIIKASSNDGDLVMDFFSGIGTTGIVCKKNNRNYILNDFTKEYVDISINYLKNKKMI